MTENLLFSLDAVSACAAMPPETRFDLVYLDPPYGVGVEMTARTRAGEGRGRRHAASGPVAYKDDRDVDELLEMLRSAASAIRPRMTDSAWFCLHMDHRAVHEAKVAMDRVFGRSAFAGEVVWVPGNGGRGKGLCVTHQTLLFYHRDPAGKDRSVWNTQHPLLREPYAKTSLAMHFQKLDDAGRLYRERTIAGKTYRYYADEGRRLGSVWTDISAMRANTPLFGEGTGYPTQKPLKLLERILMATTSEGSVVADLMCGSGTTLVAAAAMGRSFVGADRSPLAIETTSKRLRAAGAGFSCYPRPA